MENIIATYTVRYNNLSLKAYLGISRERLSVTFSGLPQDKAVYFPFDGHNLTFKEVYRHCSENAQIKSSAIFEAFLYLTFGPMKVLYSNRRMRFYG